MAATARVAAVLLAALLGAGLGGDAHANPTEAARAFDEGNRLYAVGNYRGALEAYERALDAGYESSELYYNMGSAHYRRDEIGHAIRYFERARILAPGDAEIQHNLAIVNERTQDRFSRLPIPVWERWWHGLIRGMGSWGLFASGLVFWLAAMGMLLYRQFSDARPPWARRVLAICLLLGVTLLGAAFLASAEPGRQQRGVVVAAQAPLHPEPSEAIEPELTIHEGLVVRILDTDAEWTRLRLPNGVEGWVARATIAEI